MVSMPNWFAKTPEMVASDKYFSLADAGSEAELVNRYVLALARLNQSPSDRFSDSKALSTTTTTRWSPGNTNAVLSGHFRGDWIHPLYDGVNPQYAAIGGAFWPRVRSDVVVGEITAGTIGAILKALGYSTALQHWPDSADVDRLFNFEQSNGVEDEGVRPMATSWVCVAPPGDTYFESDALRGPSVVELVYATPRPIGHANIFTSLERVRAGDFTIENLDTTE
jgi:hypothetical protein